MGTILGMTKNGVNSTKMKKVQETLTQFTSIGITSTIGFKCLKSRYHRNKVW